VRIVAAVALSCAVLAALPGVSTAAPPHPPAGGGGLPGVLPEALPGALPGALLVTLARPEAPGVSGRIARGLPGVTGPLAARPIGARVVGVRVPPGLEQAAASALARFEGVTAVERERRATLQRTPDDPRYAEQWAHRRTRAAAGWDVSTGGDVRVAVIDSGMLGSHPDLAPNVVEQVSTAGGEARVRPLHTDNDPCELGHGTFVGGIIGARGDNGVGITGVAWDVSLVDISAISPQVGCVGLPDSAILEGLRYAIHHPDGPVDVINLSFGRPADRCPAAYQSLIDEAAAAGVLVVAAAGNGEAEDNSEGRAMVPASCNGVVSVGATRLDDTRASYSSSNPFVDVAAPGGDTDDGVQGLILSTGRGTSGYAREAGTSHAAPYVAGAAALLRGLRPELTAAQIESLLERTAKDLGRQGRDNGTGWGLIQLDEALELAASDLPIAAPADDPVFPVDQSAEPWAPPTVVRLSAAGTTITTPASQAVAVSRSVFTPGQAVHAVLAREDDFADALAGSALGSGVGPLLFTARTGPLATVTRVELDRVLPAGATVYLLGGAAALPATLEQELRDQGFVPRRLAGSAREQTAVAVADEVTRLGLRRQRGVLLARSDQWPDAVAGGSLAAWFGMPILLTPPSALHPATADALRRLAPDRLYALGGSAAVSPAVLDAAGQAGGVPAAQRRRLSGAGRAETAVAIATEMESLLQEHEGTRPGAVLAVNVRRTDGFAHALSASALSGSTGAVIVPVEGQTGTTLPQAAQDYVRGFGLNGILIGGADVVSEGVGRTLQTLLRG